MDIVKITTGRKFRIRDLHSYVDFTTPFTVKDLFQFLRRGLPNGIDGEKQCIELFGAPFTDFYQEIKSKKKRETIDDVVLKTVVISWNGYKSEDGYTSRWEVYALAENDEQTYAIDFRPMYELKDCVIVIDKFMHIMNYTRSDMPIEKIEFTPNITLFDLIWTIICEVSWNGLPEDRDERWEDLKRRIKEVESDSTKFIPAEEVFANLRSKFASKDSENKPDK